MRIWPTGKNEAAAPRLSSAEFIALIAMLFATIAFSIDAMLPALPRIAAELSPGAPNKAQLIMSFVFGMGIGTFFAGPLSDSFGRKPVIVGGAALYSLAVLAAWAAPSLETPLLARLALAAQVLASLIMAGMTGFDLRPQFLAFPAYIVWTTGVFFMAGLTLRNLNALALEPVGHIAGMAASVTGAVSTVLAVLLAVPLGLAFDGTPVPLALGVAALAAAGYALMKTLPSR